MKSRFLTIAGLALLIVSGSSFPAAALKISPFKAAMVAGTDTSKVFHVENNSSESAAVQISMETWSITPEGTEVNRDAEDEFTVFPAQVVLKPHERRAVRIQWLGSDLPQKEKAYRVLAEQIPISLLDTPAAGSGLKFLLRFKAGLYIGPAKPAADVVVAKTEPHGLNTLRVTLQNNGTGHTLMRNPQLTLTLEDGQTVIVKDTDLRGLAGSNMHAGSTRYFDVSVPSGLSSVKAAHLVFESAF